MSKSDLSVAVENLSQAVDIQHTGIVNVPRWAIVEVLEVLQPFYDVMKATGN
jgi:hypothetical protein